MRGLGGVAHDPQPRPWPENCRSKRWTIPFLSIQLAGNALPVAAATGDAAFYDKVLEHLKAALKLRSKKDPV